MYLTLSQLRKVIREELGRISDVKDPAEVGAVEDAWAGGDDLVDPFEYVPADRKADEEKPPKRKPLKEQNDNSIKVKKLADVLAYLAAAQDDLDELTRQEYNLNQGSLEDSDTDLFSDLHDSVDAVYSEVKNAISALAQGNVVRASDVTQIDLPGDDA